MERRNVTEANAVRRPGASLTAMWTVYGVEDDRGVLVLVGFEPYVSTFLAELGADSAPVGGDATAVRVAVLGSWPFEKACALVRAIHAPHSTPRAWARVARRVALPDPDRKLLEHVDDEMLAELLAIFAESLERSQTDG